MSPVPEQILAEPKSDSSRMTALALVDAMSAGDFDRGVLMRQLNTLAKEFPEDAWELLSVVDQHYRRRKISSERYHAINSYLSGLLLGGTRATYMGVQPRAPQAPTRRTGMTVPIDAVESLSVSAAPLAQVAAAVRALSAGDVLRGRYRLLRIIGQGGTGTVFEAGDQFDAELPEGERRVAVKVLHSTVGRQPDLLCGLLREFQCLQSLSHPNIVRVHEFDRDGETAFFTMELLSGVPLSRVLSERGGAVLDRPHARAIIADVGAALAYAHLHGVVHGDINPQNIFVTNDGEIRIFDFGAFKKRGDGPWIAESADADGSHFATPEYASCELLEGLGADVRDDLFGFACVCYLLLAGEHPYGGRTAIQARTARMRPRRPNGLTGGQWHALREGLCLEHDRRPSDIREWTRRLNSGVSGDRLPMLHALVSPPSPRRRTALRAAIVAALLLAAAGGSWFATNGGRPLPKLPAVSAEAQRAVLRVDAAWSRLWVAAMQIVQPGANAAATEIVKPVAHSEAAAPILRSSSPMPRDTTARHDATRVSAVAAINSEARHAPAAAVTGPARIEMASSLVEVSPAEPFARVIVQRRGNRRSDVTFNWWTESGTAKPGKDFVAYSSHPETIAAGAGDTSLLIPIVSDPTRTEAKSFYVIIDEPGPGGLLGERTVAMVTIPASQ